MMELVANPDHYRGKPKIERVVLKFVGGAGLNELLSGNADVVLSARVPSPGSAIILSSTTFACAGRSR